ncbi:efflux RND transporter periplasmic adaptor subunit [Sphingobacterium yanglingense]|uniref:Cobalt-zinc-cadmium efflux system membrane fusion protein n=1 Tax=Sphingobacterium yanglingense TaxID=1437280 RepID=A0A4R6WTH4_9SPHI|nr:efflux RND transporter periplasmic adaptor subunit [Sphingobacterium yanglingense]TDQ80066.1 cobalt-zinc-cadmium efflux system membrane fusion protein [Sphingobacterium yanglingense]
MKYLASILITLLFFSCGGGQATDEPVETSGTENILELSDAQLASFTLSSTAVEEKKITQTLKLNGKIEVPPQNLISVSSALGGYVKSIKLLPGMFFKKGDRIAELEDNQFIQLQQDYLIVKNQLENAESEYLRQRELNQSKASSDKVYLQAKADYQTLQINQQALAQKLKLIHINPDQLNVRNIKQTVHLYAPFDGFVSQVFVNTGKYVSASEVLFELVNPSDLHLNLKVFEKDWNKIKIGQQLTAYANSDPSKTYLGQVILIGKNISTDRAVDIRVRLNEVGGTLIPGMYMNGAVVVPETTALALPEESVVDFEGGKYVFEIIDRNKFKMISVQCGDHGDGWVSIVNSEQLRNKKIALQGAYTLLMALKNKGEE